jgi:transposase-like protein
MDCVRCGSAATRRDGQTRLGGQRWRCTVCRRLFTARSASAFSRHCFPDDVIALAVRWSVRYRLSYAAVVEWLAGRGIAVDRSTVHRWVQRCLPLVRDAARPHRAAVGGPWRVDETSRRLRGRRASLHRAIDHAGQVVDLYFRARRHAAAAEASFARAIAEAGVPPARGTTDKARCYPPALRAALPGAEHRAAQYLHNGLACDHGHGKQRLRPMRGRKRPAAGETLGRGHALIQNLRTGFASLTAGVPRPLRLAAAWPQLARLI